MNHAHIVVESEHGERADVVIARAAHAPRSVVADAVKGGMVTLNGTTIKGSARVASGDELRFSLDLPEPLRAHPEELPLDIVFEDETLIVVNKPAGMVTHPAHGSPRGTLVNALLAHTRELPGDQLRAGLIHRLDRDTSGLLLVAKTPDALATLGRALQARYIEREYLGLAAGNPPQDAGTLDGPIGRDEHHRLRRAIRADGKPAVTHFTVRERLPHAAELSFRLETGRTHQIRVHMAAYGYPIVNDQLYGKTDARLPLPGQALHARKLGFRHPVTREHLVFEVTPPPGYLEARDILRKL